MIGKASVFAIVLLAPGFAFAADSTATTAAPAPAVHDTASATTTKSDVKSDSAPKGKVAKAKTHKDKAGVAEKKTDQKS